MATLTETAYYSRKIIKWGIVALIGFVILRITFSALFNAIRRAFPPPPLKVNNAFGKLPKINFPKGASPSGELKFTLQTIEGSVPEASEAARVFFMPKNRVNLLSLSQAQSFVKRLRFTATPRQLTDTLYRWIDLEQPLRTIEMDIVSNHFTLNYLYIHDLGLFEEKQVPSRDQALAEVKNFFQNLGLSITDLDITNAKISYLKLAGDKLVPATSQSTSDAVQINIMRNGLSGLPVLTDKKDSGSVTMIISGSRESHQRLLQVKYQYWPVDTKTSGIYKLKTSTEAWQELVAGQGYFAKILPKQTQIPITQVYLSYYDSEASQLFLQPVFVFEGEDFVAYIPAIAPPWTE